MRLKLALTSVDKAPFLYLLTMTLMPKKLLNLNHLSMQIGCFKPSKASHCSEDKIQILSHGLCSL